MWGTPTVSEARRSSLVILNDREQKSSPSFCSILSEPLSALMPSSAKKVSIFVQLYVAL